MIYWRNVQYWLKLHCLSCLRWLQMTFVQHQTFNYYIGESYKASQRESRLSQHDTCLLTKQLKSYGGALICMPCPGLPRMNWNIWGEICHHVHTLSSTHMCKLLALRIIRQAKTNRPPRTGGTHTHTRIPDVTRIWKAFISKTEEPSSISTHAVGRQKTKSCIYPELYLPWVILLKLLK